MRLVSGKDRLVVITEKLAIKSALAEPHTALRIVTDEYRDSGSRGVKMLWASRGNISPSSKLYHGVEANRTEARLAALYPRIVVPTKMLMNGLINLQPVVGVGRLESDVIWSAFHDALGDFTPRLGHELEDPNNFGVMPDGRVKFIDGGSVKLDMLLRQGGEEMVTKALENVGSLL